MQGAGRQTEANWVGVSGARPLPRDAAVVKPILFAAVTCHHGSDVEYLMAMR
jgi:hypothetical protein